VVSAGGPVNHHATAGGASYDDRRVSSPQA
jgi:hypothetical protein